MTAFLNRVLRDHLKSQDISVAYEKPLQLEETVQIVTTALS